MRKLHHNKLCASEYDVIPPKLSLRALFRLERLAYNEILQQNLKLTESKIAVAVLFVVCILAVAALLFFVGRVSGELVRFDF